MINQERFGHAVTASENEHQSAMQTLASGSTLNTMSTINTTTLMGIPVTHMTQYHAEKEEQEPDVSRNGNETFYPITSDRAPEHLDVTSENGMLADQETNVLPINRAKKKKYHPPRRRKWQYEKEQESSPQEKNSSEPQEHPLGEHDIPINENSTPPPSLQHDIQFDDPKSSFTESPSQLETNSLEMDYRHFGISPVIPAPFITDYDACASSSINNNNLPSYVKSQIQREFNSQFVQDCPPFDNSDIQNTIYVDDATIATKTSNLLRDVPAYVGNSGHVALEEASRNEKAAYPNGNVTRFPATSDHVHGYPGRNAANGVLTDQNENDLSMNEVRKQKQHSPRKGKWPIKEENEMSFQGNNSNNPQKHSLVEHYVPIKAFSTPPPPLQHNIQYESSYTRTPSQWETNSLEMDYRHFGISPVIPAALTTEGDAFAPIVRSNLPSYARSFIQQESDPQLMQIFSRTDISDFPNGRYIGNVPNAKYAAEQKLARLTERIKASLDNEVVYEFDQLSRMRHQYINIMMEEASSPEEMIQRIYSIYNEGMLD